ncbi:MAG TPA: phospholipase D-like domain-containing protein [bacterium]|nr:phospholipase D-like domain-containing protein [bacterium]
MLIPKFRSLPSRLLSLIETLLLFSLGLFLYFFILTEPPPIEEVVRLPSADATGPEEETPGDEPDTASSPAALRERYDFDGGELLFDDAVEPALVALIDAAGSRLRAVTYTAEACPAIAAIERAAARGVEVKVVAGRSQFKRRPSFPLTEFHPPKGILHEKFVVADGRTVFLSSRNLSGGQSKNAAILFSDAPKLAALLTEEFDALKEMRIEKRCEKGCRVEFGTIYFLPGTGCRAAKEDILSARSGLDVAMYTLTLGIPPLTGVKKLLKKGKKARFIVDDWSGEPGEAAVNARAARYLESLGATVLFDHLLDGRGEPMNFHHKFAVVDGGAATVFGSMNWTKAGCYRNREVLFLSRDREIGAAFSSYFEDILQAVPPASVRQK